MKTKHHTSSPPDITTHLRALQDVIEVLATARDPQTLIQAVVHQLTTRLGYPIAGVVIRTSDRPSFTLEFLHPRDFLDEVLGPDFVATLQELETGFDPANWPGHRSLLAGEPWVTRSLSDFVPPGLAEVLEQETRVYLGEEAAYIGVPAISGGEVVAAFAVVTPAREIPPEELEVLLAVARQMGVALESARLYQAERRSRQQLESLQETVAAISEKLELDELLPTVVRQAAEALNAPAASLMLLDQPSDSLRIVASHGLSDEYVQEQVIPRERALAVTEAADWQPYVLPDLRQVPLGKAALVQEEDLGSVLVIPMRVGEEWSGALNIYSKGEPRAFTQEEIRLASALGRQAAIAIENAQLYEEARHRLAEMATLRELFLHLSQPQPLQNLLQRIVEEAARLLATNAGGLYLYDEEAGELEVAVSHAPEQDYRGLRMKVGEGLAGKVVETGEPMAVADYASWPGRSPKWDDTRWRSAVASPLKWGDRILGVIYLTSLSPHEREPFDVDDLRLLSHFAQQAAVAVENAHLVESLRREKAFSERLIETAPALIVVLDPKGRVLLFNQACEKLTGYRKEEVLGTIWCERFIPERHRADLASVLEQLEAGDVPHDYENPIIAYDDQERIVAWSNSVVRDESGQVQQVLAVGQDVTEQRRAEQEVLRRTIELEMLVQAGREFSRGLDWEPTLRRVAQRAQEFLDADTCTLYLLQPDGETLRPAIALDPEAEQVMDYPLRVGQGITGHVVLTGEPELVNHAEQDPRAAHVPGTDVEPESLLCVPLVIRKETIGVITLSHLGGREFSREDLRLVTGLTNLAASAIQNARLYQQARQEATHRANIMESMTEGLILLDTSWRIIEVNQALCRITGFAREEFVGKLPPFPHWPPQRADEYSAIVQQLLAEPKPLRSLEVTFLHKDGTIFPSLISPSPVRDEDGVVTGFISVHQDLTERQALEEQLRQAQKMEAIGTLAGGIAHDFNNILVGILGYASLLQSELPEASPLQSDVATIIQSARRAADLTQQLLSFARRADRQMELVGLVDLNELVQEVATLLKETVDRRIEIYAGLTSDLPAVEGNASQLQQVILNLGINACEAMPEGGRLVLRASSLELSTAEAAGYLDLEPGPYVVLEVTDTGIGMDDATRRHIFEPFFTTKEHGRGLGLATSYGIVSAHQGTIHVQSAPGEGTTFRVLLPASEKAPPGIHPTLESHPAGGSETILVVDDEETVREMLVRALQLEGYRVLEAEDGQQAVEVFAQYEGEVDLVVLDLIMPRLSGAETFQRLWEVEPGVRVLVSSGYSPDEKSEPFLQKNAEGFLQKPYDVDQVLLAVRQVLDRG